MKEPHRLRESLQGSPLFFLFLNYPSLTVGALFVGNFHIFPNLCLAGKGDLAEDKYNRTWIPAYAGMTEGSRRGK